MNDDVSPDAKAAITTEFQPTNLENGHTAYRLRDGGKVIDDGKEARIAKSSQGAIALSLLMTASCAPGQSIAITQTDKQDETLKAAARNKLNISFKNPEVEQERRRLLMVFEREEVTLAASVFVAQKNAEHAGNSNKPEYRLWGENDAGEAIFESMEDLGEDTHAALLRRSNELLVKPLIAEEFVTFSDHLPGAVIQVTPPPEAQQPKTENQFEAKPKKRWWR